jgi:Ribonuclease G/E
VSAQPPAAAAGTNTVIHAAWSPGEVRIAVIAERVLLDYALWRPGTPDGFGDIHRGRVTAVVPAMAGAFLAIGGTEDAFLPDSEGAKGMTEGTILTVRVTRAAQSGKGPRVSGKIESAGDGPIGLVRLGEDPLHELAARYPGAPVLIDDPGLAATLRASLGPRVRVVPRAFDDALEAWVEALAEPEVTLPSGVRLAIWPTPALVSIDVDTGAALSAGGRPASAEQRHRALNEAALPALARQIRLRNLSGAILVDFAGMRVKQRGTLARSLAAALSRDPMRPRFLGFTQLGLAEILRPRGRAPLHEAMAGPLAAGLAALRAVAAAVRADPGARPVLRAAPPVVAALEADSVALADAARSLGQRLTIRSDPSFSAGTWRLEDHNG